MPFDSARERQIDLELDFAATSRVTSIIFCSFDKKVLSATALEVATSAIAKASCTGMLRFAVAGRTQLVGSSV